ncbi:MAG TPA: hypothetical protein VH601_24120 [Bryobacteraceae bacterium]|jgi:hypothetical protein
MKRLLICSIVVLGLTIGAYASRAGDTIKIFVIGRDARSLISDFNAHLGDQSLRLEIVESESDADVSVMFQDDIGNPNADAVSHAYRGHIAIANSAPEAALTLILAHELLHCAGAGHEPEDTSSVMYVQTRTHGQLTESQIRDLRRLSGITWPERIIAQVRAKF